MLASPTILSDVSIYDERKDILETLKKEGMGKYNHNKIYLNSQWQIPAPYFFKMHILPTNSNLLAGQPEPNKKRLSL